MGNDLVVFEKQLTPLAPRFKEALAGVMPVERLIRTAIVSAEKNSFLLECDRQSFFNSIMTAGVLGLEMDGVTGQAFPIPFKRRIQLVIGYKGYNTLGARSGLTITGEVVREGDIFDYEQGTNPFLKFKEGPTRGRITHAWAVAAANNRPPVISVLKIDDLMAIKNKSPGAKKDDSPWNDPNIGFPAMCSKSAKRRLARSTPLNVMQLAARMEEAFEEQGKAAFITPDRNLIIEGEASPLADVQRNETPDAEQLTAPRTWPDDPLADMNADGEIAAKEGTYSLRIWFGDLPPQVQRKIKPYLDATLKPMAAHFDEKLGVDPETGKSLRQSAPVEVQTELLAEDVEAFLAEKRQALQSAESGAAVNVIVSDVTEFLKRQKRMDMLADFLSAAKKRGERVKETA